jgi:hypothetical protein
MNSQASLDAQSLKSWPITSTALDDVIVRIIRLIQTKEGHASSPQLMQGSLAWRFPITNDIRGQQTTRRPHE